MDQQLQQRRAQLKRAGLRVTPMRLAVLELLAQEPHAHLTTEQIYQRLSKPSKRSTLSTVYRVLADLEGAQLVQRHQFHGESSVFELNRHEPHDHLVCNRCGQVVEFNDADIAERLEQIADTMGFEIRDRALHLRGGCQRGCRQGGDDDGEIEAPPPPGAD
ncbi:MAG: Fur family transcriptional regulator [Candidatus Competibacterales bacterium]